MRGAIRNGNIEFINHLKNKYKIEIDQEFFYKCVSNQKNYDYNTSSALICKQQGLYITLRSPVMKKIPTFVKYMEMINYDKDQDITFLVSPENKNEVLNTIFKYIKK